MILTLPPFDSTAEPLAGLFPFFRRPDRRADLSSAGAAPRPVAAAAHDQAAAPAARWDGRAVLATFTGIVSTGVPLHDRSEFLPGHLWSMTGGRPLAVCLDTIHWTVPVPVFFDHSQPVGWADELAVGRGKLFVTRGRILDTPAGLQVFADRHRGLHASIGFGGAALASGGKWKSDLRPAGPGELVNGRAVGPGVMVATGFMLDEISITRRPLDRGTVVLVGPVE